MRMETWVTTASRRTCSSVPDNPGAALRERSSGSSQDFGKFGQCAWIPGQLQPAEGPARACPDNPGAALRERSSGSSDYCVQSLHSSWLSGKPWPSKGVGGACFEHPCATRQPLCRTNSAPPGTAGGDDGACVQGCSGEALSAEGLWAAMLRAVCHRTMMQRLYWSFFLTFPRKKIQTCWKPSEDFLRSHSRGDC